MSRKSLRVVLTDAEAIRLEQWIRAGSTPQQVVLRARILREAALGQSDKSIALELGIRRETAALWRRRGHEQGIGCVWEIAPANVSNKSNRIHPTQATQVPISSYAELITGHYTRLIASFINGGVRQLNLSASQKLKSRGAD